MRFMISLAKIAAASRNHTRCLERLALAFSPSHSNSGSRQQTACRYSTQLCTRQSLSLSSPSSKNNPKTRVRPEVPRAPRGVVFIVEQSNEAPVMPAEVENSPGTEIICMLFISRTVSILYGWLVGLLRPGTSGGFRLREKAVDCQHDETDRQNGPNYTETKAV
jgi:hypothetical protein